MRDDLDQLIDGALTQYANPEPLAGIEQRMIGRARAAAYRRRWWRWGAAIPVAAALLVVLTQRPKPAPQTPAVAIIAPAPSLPPVTAPILRQAVSRRPRTAVAAPKRATFPTASPITDQERLLLRLAQSHPEQLLVRPPDVLEVKPIEIAPLEIDGRQ